MSLEDEIAKTSLQVKTDSYSISIGELVSLYGNKEIELHPQFQRFFRWTPAQKTRLIESILLGIPLPPIFVAQREDGIWDVVDGLQRLSSILQFIGVLRQEDGTVCPALTLENARYLPGLAGKTWEGTTTSKSFTPAQRLFVKRAKLGVNIILKESDDNAKYELFQRLNTGGSQLSDQEVRSCLLIMVRRDLFEWLETLSKNQAFQESIALTDRALEEQFDLELALRFVLLRSLSDDEQRKVGDLGDYITDRVLDFARTPDVARKKRMATEAVAFASTFQALNDELGEDAFRRFDRDRNEFVGGFLISAFEGVALGLGYHMGSKTVKKHPQGWLKTRVEKLWSEQPFQKGQSSGVRASTRLPKILPVGRKMFAP